MNLAVLTRTALYLSLIALLSTTSAEAQNLVKNGGFEAPSILPGPWFQAAAAGSGAIPQWNVGVPSPPAQTNQGVDIINNVNHSAWAHTGSQSIDISGSPGPGKLSQDLKTVPGHPYSLTFFASSVDVTGSTASLSIRWDGNLIDTIDTPQRGTWQVFTYCVTASGPTTSLEFISELAGDEGALIDTVSVHDISSGNQVVNGDFEQPTISATSVFIPAGLGIPNWYVGGVDLVSTVNGRSGFAHTGNQAVELAAAASDTTAMKTQPGIYSGTYRLSFAVSSNGGAKANSLIVKWGSTFAVTLSTPPEGTWTEHSFLVTNPRDVISFHGLIEGEEGALVDSVSVIRACP